MSDRSHRRADDLDALLSGPAPEGDPTTRALVETLSQLRASLTRPVTDSVADAHLTAIADAAREAAAARPGWRERVAGLVVRPEPASARVPRWAGLGILGLLGFIGGLAAAGALPGPAQRFVADTASHVGINLPDKSSPTAGEAPHGKAHGTTKESGSPAGPSTQDHGSGGEHGKVVSTIARDSSLQGCEHGQAVREAASSKNQASPDAEGHRADRDPCARTTTSSSGTSGQGGDEESSSHGPTHATGAARAEEKRSSSANPGRSSSSSEAGQGVANQRRGGPKASTPTSTTSD